MANYFDENGTRTIIPDFNGTDTECTNAINYSKEIKELKVHTCMEIFALILSGISIVISIV